MKLGRRKFLHLAGGAVALPAISRVAMAQTYPTRLVRIICGAPPGGPQDIVARLTAQWLSERLGQQFIVENRTGGGGNIAADAVVRSPPDGYTILLIASPNAINATLYDKLNFNFVRDIAPVAPTMHVPLVLEVHPTVPVNTVPEFIAFIKANPDKFSLGSGGIGTPAHVGGQLFTMMAGIHMVQVPYRGSAPMLIDLLGGQLQAAFDPLPGSIEHIRAGKLRPLAVTTTMRSDLLSNVPTLGEFIQGYEASVWYGFGVPRKTPVEIVDKLSSQIATALNDPIVKARFADFGGTVFTLSPVDFGRLIVEETEKWGKVIRAANIKID
jgi:tripartite-type tricarboxylate transporter receptor subunit TctC